MFMFCELQCPYIHSSEKITSSSSGRLACSAFYNSRIL